MSQLIFAEISAVLSFWVRTKEERRRRRRSNTSTTLSTSTPLLWLFYVSTTSIQGIKYIFLCNQPVVCLSSFQTKGTSTYTAWRNFLQTLHVLPEQVKTYRVFEVCDYANRNFSYSNRTMKRSVCFHESYKHFSDEW